ncbi:hypothetical protein Pka01_64740 [Planotetraspora kaengkrachanensis]|uniref:Uncharacterized protein n=1 Tax=Planotetraspora kaengkrachanensis TaxID=575193 RepID=A0A8J3PYH1_9ACTN|nr:hypothetical protein Pka01_64740 [Planotetraspora kaengkrachanensis]
MTTSSLPQGLWVGDAADPSGRVDWVARGSVVAALGEFPADLLHEGGGGGLARQHPTLLGEVALVGDGDRFLGRGVSLVGGHSGSVQRIERKTDVEPGNGGLRDGTGLTAG